MAATKFTRNKDYSDDADNNAGGRSSIDPAGLDGEMDEIATATDDHADKLDLVLRADLKLLDNILQGHEFSSTAITVLKGLIGNANAALNETGPWVTATVYEVGDLAEDSGSSYYCLEDHTAGASFATDLSASKWRLFASAGSTSFPAGASINDVLFYGGATEAWGKVSAAMAPLHALLASPTFTGTVTMPNTGFEGYLRFAVDTVTFSAGGNAFDFNTAFMKQVDVTGNYTSACSVANPAVGASMEIHFSNTTGGQVALLWDSNWEWMGYAPTILGASKKAVLSLRMPTGATASDVIAMWSVQP